MPLQFSDLGIHKELQARLVDLEISVPTEVQKKVIPFVLERKKDLVALAKTGTGKTAAFGLPLLQLINTEENSVQVVIMAPTRELGQQIHANLTLFASYDPEISVVGLFGGVTLKSQIEALKRTTHIVVATPGRLIDLIERKAIDIKNILYLVLDEADEMMGALHAEVETIFKEIPKNTRTLLFTATMPGVIKQLVQNYLSKNPVTIEADMATIGHQGILHQYTVVEPIEKLEVLLHFLYAREGQKGIIFCKTKAAVNKLGKNLAKNKFSSGTIHGSLTQGIRDRVMGQFREGHVDVLVATDLAARGIDIPEMKYIIHFQLPLSREEFTHRNGRTARVSAKGTAYVLKWKEERLPEFIGTPPIEDISKQSLRKPVFWETLFISGGRKDKISKGDIAGLFIKQGKLTKDQLGDIELKQDCAFVAVPATLAADLAEKLNNSRLKKKKVRIYGV